MDVSNGKTSRWLFRWRLKPHKSGLPGSSKAFAKHQDRTLVFPPNRGLSENGHRYLPIHWSSHGKYHFIGSMMINNGIIGAFSPKFSDKPLLEPEKNHRSLESAVSLQLHAALQLALAHPHLALSSSWQLVNDT